MPQKVGYAIIVDPDRPKDCERDTFTCRHCNRIVFMHAEDGTKLQGVAVHCHGCDEWICVPCAEIPKCDTIEQKLERSEARGRLLSSMGL